MLLAMVEDIRVVLIKLAERTADAALPHAGGADRATRAQQAARETLDLFAPLANRLGVWQLKWELEDLSLARARARAYKRDRARCSTSAALDRERYIERRHRHR